MIPQLSGTKRDGKRDFPSFIRGRQNLSPPLRHTFFLNSIPAKSYPRFRAHLYTPQIHTNTQTITRAPFQKNGPYREVY